MPDGRVYSRSYSQNSDAERTPIDVFVEEFGFNETDYYTKAIYQGDTNSVITQQTDLGTTYTIQGDKNITVTALYDGTYTVDAETKVVLNAPAIEIGEGSTESLVLGNALETWITGFINSAFNTHIHATGVGPSAPPTTPGTPPTAGEWLSAKNTTD